MPIEKEKQKANKTRSKNLPLASGQMVDRNQMQTDVNNSDTAKNSAIADLLYKFVNGKIAHIERHAISIPNQTFFVNFFIRVWIARN